MRSSSRVGRRAPMFAVVMPAIALACGVLALSVLAACERMPMGKAHVFKCSEGVVVRVAFSESDETATMRLAGKTYRLKLIPSGSGAKYSDGKVVFWNKGDEALILIDGELVHDGCRLVE